MNGFLRGILHTAPAAVWFLMPALLQAVIIRHDRADALYLSLGKRFSAVCHMNLPDGEGTLIAPRWVLTAAHVAVDVPPGHRVSIAGRNYAVEAVFINPDWRSSRHDIALVKLRERVRRVRPLALYRGSDETGRIVTILGSGFSGTGLTGPRKNDGRLRGARNRIDEVNKAWIMFRFDPPETALDLEGISAPGDSGGPALLEESGRFYVAGISSIQSFHRPGMREGRYGVLEYYSRVSAYSAWIDRILRENSTFRESRPWPCAGF